MPLSGPWRVDDEAAWAEAPETREGWELVGEFKGELEGEPDAELKGELDEEFERILTGR